MRIGVELNVQKSETKKRERDRERGSRGRDSTERLGKSREKTRQREENSEDGVFKRRWGDVDTENEEDELTSEQLDAGYKMIGSILMEQT